MTLQLRPVFPSSSRGLLCRWCGRRAGREWALPSLLSVPELDILTLEAQEETREEEENGLAKAELFVFNKLKRNIRKTNEKRHFFLFTSGIYSSCDSPWPGLSLGDLDASQPSLWLSNFTSSLQLSILVSSKESCFASTAVSGRSPILRRQPEKSSGLI